LTSAFCLGEWLVQPELNDVACEGRTVHLEPKVMQVLVALATRPGQVLSKEEILQDVWADAFVTDEVLTNAIWELRKALSDNARTPLFIQTVPRRGYRLVAPVTLEALAPKKEAEAPQAPVEETPPETPPSAPPHGSRAARARLDRRSSLLISAFLLLTIVAVALTASQWQDWKGRRLLVAVTYQAGADIVITGMVVGSGSEIRVMAQIHDLTADELIDAPVVQGIWPDDVLPLEDELSSKVREALEVEATRDFDAAEKIASIKTGSLEAYNQYVLASKSIEEFSHKEAIVYLRQAVNLDPQFAYAWDLLAHAYDYLGERKLASDAIAKAVRFSANLPKWTSCEFSVGRLRSKKIFNPNSKT
jgi:DNA-binding winged helix-turn-helix (wHTH) protein